MSGATGFPQERKAPNVVGVSLRPLKKGAKIPIIIKILKYKK
ncbi:hypothetical protein CLONEX_01302 [[Clostridium] nexile DSM 1787]|nr:hypothetical protein CLONEX_01302 [[Clostridium] nexile DSM 1787]